MPFRGISIDDEGSIIYDGEKFIVNHPSKVPDNFDPGDKPVVGLPKTHPSHPQNRQRPPTPENPPPPPYGGPGPVIPGIVPIRPGTPPKPANQPNGSFVAGETGFSAGGSHPAFVPKKKEEKQHETGSSKPSLSGFLQDMEYQPDINETGLPDIVDMQDNPMNSAADMKFYIAARHNPVLNEVQTTIQYEGIPSAFQGDSERYLRLCGEYGIDEENDAEARACLDYWTQQLLDPDIRQQSIYDLMFRANAPWEDAKDKLGTHGAEESLKNYQTSIENTFNVMFTSDDGADRWNLANIRTAHLGLEMAARVFGNRLRDIGLAVDDATAFQFIFGKIELNRSTKEHEAVAQVVGDTITIFRNGSPEESSSRNYNLLPYVLLHELGHIFNAAAGMGNKDGNSSINQTMGHPKTRSGTGAPAPPTLIGKLFIASHPDLRPLYQDMGVSVDHELFDEADLGPRQIQPLQQSLDTSPNEVTADAFLNWIVHQTSGGFEGFTDTPEGLAWQEFMNQNMDKWIRNAIVYNARDNTNAMTVFAESGILPEAIGIGTITAEKGAYIRETPSIANDNVVTLVKKGETLPVFGRIEVESKHPNWIATMARGDIHWVYSGVIKLLEGVKLNDLPVFESEEDASFEFDPTSSLENTDWFPQLVRYLVQEGVDA